MDLIFTSDIIGDGYITSLQQQWCNIGLPYNITIAKEDLIIEYNGTDYSWYQATTDNNEEGEPLILGYIYGWNSNSQAYVLSDNLGPDKGYWMYAYYNCILKKE